MKTGFIPCLILAVLILLPLTETRAQQGAYVSVLLARYAAFNKLYTEKKQAGADLSAIEPIRSRAEAGFQKGDLDTACSRGFWMPLNGTLAVPSRNRLYRRGKDSIVHAL